MDNHLLSHAIAIATEAHKGQKDKYGQEYLHHPIRVMNMGRNLKERIVGILHDVVEDTEWTFEDLEKEGFSAEIIEAVRCVTKTSDEEDYEEYVERYGCAPHALHRRKRSHQTQEISESLPSSDAPVYESLIIMHVSFS